MVNRISMKFDKLKNSGKKALITYVMVGDPSLEGTKEIVKQMVKCGSDIVELGIPCMNPVADGEVIKRANLRALDNCINMKDIIETVSDIRKEVDVPFIFLSYYERIIQYGFEEFFLGCMSAGVDGVIIPDLPDDRRLDVEITALKYGVYLITVITPAFKDGIEKYIKNAKGFLYCATSEGVTGKRNSFETDFGEYLSLIDRYTNVPKALGFGISSSNQIRQLRGYCDGLIMGSAVVERIENSVNIENAVENVGIFISNSRHALDA